MNTEELYIWRYGIGKLPKGLLEYGKSDVCDIYDESKRQKFQNLGQWMWQNNDGWRENLPPVLFLVCNKKPGILQFDFLDKSSIELKIVSEEKSYRKSFCLYLKKMASLKNMILLPSR